MEEQEPPPLEEAPLADEVPSADESEPPDRPRRRRRRRKRRLLRWLLGLVVLAVVFVIGLSLGRSLEETPQPGGEQTGIRTLEPSTLGPTRTVTVTVPE